MLLWLTALFVFFLTDCSSPLHSVCLRTAQETCFSGMQEERQWTVGAFPSFEVLDGDSEVDTALAVG